jgi:hypothetical protein
MSGPTREASNPLKIIAIENVCPKASKIMRATMRREMTARGGNRAGG